MSLDTPFSTEPSLFLHDHSASFAYSPPTELLGSSAHTVNLEPSRPRQEWVQAAKVGQLVKINNRFYSLTSDAIESSLGTWHEGFIKDDHNVIRAGFKVYGDKFEDPFLCFLVDQETLTDISNGVGGSIDGRATEIIDEKLTKMVGAGYSVISSGNIPLCTKEAGCGMPLEAADILKAPIETKWEFSTADYTQEELERSCAWIDTTKSKDERTKADCKLPYKAPDGAIVWAGVHAAMAALNGARTPVNIPKSDKESVYNVLVVAYRLFDKQPPELKAGIEVKAESKGGDKGIMTDEVKNESEVLYTAAQIDERITAAVTDALENSDNAHKAEVADITTTNTDKLTEIAHTHTTELEEQKTKMFELASLIETAKTKYGLNEEQVKVLQDAKTPEEILKCFSELEIKKETEVAASTAKPEDGDTGVVVASATQKPEEKLYLGAEIGNYANNGKWE